MIGGLSSCRGILIYDTAKTGNNAIYGYYDQDEIVLLVGVYEDLKNKQKTEDRVYRQQNLESKILLRLFLFLVLISMICFMICSFQCFLGVLFFCVAGFFPILVLSYACTNMYHDDKDYHQMRRYHGCEHALVRCLEHHRYTLEELQRTSIYDNECGTVYSGTILLVIIYIAYMIITHTFVLMILRNVIVLMIVLFFNLFNPYNPFRIFQYRAIEKPTQREYLLAFELMKKVNDQSI